MTRHVKYFMAGDYQRLVTAVNQFLDEDGSTLVNIIPSPQKELSYDTVLCQALVIVEDVR